MNNISNITQQYEQHILNETGDKRRIEPLETQPLEKSADVARDDKVSLSQASKEMQLAKNAVAEQPDVREERVAALKQAIEDGQYEMDTEQMADKLVGNIISEVI